MRRKPDGTRIIARKPDETRIVRRKLDGSPKVERKSGTADASRRFAAVRAEDTKPIRAGELATGRAGMKGSDASRGLEASAARGTKHQRKLESGHWGSWRTQHRLYCE